MYLCYTMKAQNLANSTRIYLYFLNYVAYYNSISVIFFSHPKHFLLTEYGWLI